MDEDLKMISSTKDLGITASKDQKVDFKHCSPGCKIYWNAIIPKKEQFG